MYLLCRMYILVLETIQLPHALLGVMFLNLLRLNTCKKPRTYEASTPYVLPEATYTVFMSLHMQSVKVCNTFRVRQTYGVNFPDEYSYEYMQKRYTFFVCLVEFVLDIGRGYC